MHFQSSSFGKILISSCNSNIIVFLGGEKRAEGRLKVKRASVSSVELKYYFLSLLVYDVIVIIILFQLCRLATTSCATSSYKITNRPVQITAGGAAGHVAKTCFYRSEDRQVCGKERRRLQGEGRGGGATAFGRADKFWRAEGITGTAKRWETARK